MYNTKNTEKGRRKKKMIKLTSYRHKYIKMYMKTKCCKNLYLKGYVLVTRIQGMVRFFFVHVICVTLILNGRNKVMILEDVVDTNKIVQATVWMSLIFYEIMIQKGVRRSFVY